MESVKKVAVIPYEMTNRIFQQNYGQTTSSIFNQPEVDYLKALDESMKRIL